MPWTYASLQQAILDWSENPEPTMQENLPNIIKMAEVRIAEVVQLPVLRKPTVGKFTSGVDSVPLPDDFLSPYQFQGIDRGGVFFPIFNKEDEFRRAAYPDPGYRAKPRYFSISGTFPQGTVSTGALYVAPAPDWTYGYLLNYFSRPPSIVDYDTSYIGNNAEDVLFFACMKNAAVFMKEEADLVKTYDDMFQEAVANFSLTGQGRQRKDWMRKPDRRKES